MNDVLHDHTGSSLRDVSPSGRENVGTASFYELLQSFDDFMSVADGACYTALPDDWSIGLADVVGSTKAIAKGRYKAVNVVGAAVVAAVGNALRGIDFPFVFGGDGASFAVPNCQLEPAAGALASTARWAQQTLHLGLRTGLVSVTSVRAAGVDVKVARYQSAPDVCYAMFSGGGLTWAEAQLKAGMLDAPYVDASVRPDLTGLTCDFATLASRRGLILSLIILPRGDDQAFSGLARDVLSLVKTEESLSPVPWRKLDSAWSGTEIAHAVALVNGTGGRSPPPPTSMSGDLLHLPQQSTDFEKFGDGLRMTIDCASKVADALEAMLDRAQADGICRFGTHRQDAVNLTCVLPVLGGRHAHFIDGAAGGYAAAALKIKRQL